MMLFKLLLDCTAIHRRVCGMDECFSGEIKTRVGAGCQGFTSMGGKENNFPIFLIIQPQASRMGESMRFHSPVDKVKYSFYPKNAEWRARLPEEILRGCIIAISDANQRYGGHV